jgi:hypothetical protein
MGAVAKVEVVGEFSVVVVWLLVDDVVVVAGVAAVVVVWLLVDDVVVVAGVVVVVVVVVSGVPIES